MGKSHKQRNLSVCWKCRWLIEDPGGFYGRKKKNGPCDKCLMSLTTFQIAMFDMIWRKQLPPKENYAKAERRKKFLEEKRRKENEFRRSKTEVGVSSKDNGISKTDRPKQ